MSKLIDKLSKQRQSEPQQMGFMLRKAEVEKPKMLLLAELSADNLGKWGEALKAADGLIVDVNKPEDLTSAEKASQGDNLVPVGAWLKTSSAAVLKKAADTECDFLTFSSDIPVTLTRKEKMGRILDIDINLSEGLLRSAGELPLDACIVTGKHIELDLTLNRLMYIQRLLLLVNKPVLVVIENGLSAPELQSLWDMGVGGVVVEVADQRFAEKLADLRGIIDKLEAPAFRKKAKSTAILPRMQAEAPQPEHEEEEEEDE